MRLTEINNKYRSSFLLQINCVSHSPHRLLTSIQFNYIIILFHNVALISMALVTAASPTDFGPTSDNDRCGVDIPALSNLYIDIPALSNLEISINRYSCIIKSRERKLHVVLRCHSGSLRLIVKMLRQQILQILSISSHSFASFTSSLFFNSFISSCLRSATLFHCSACCNAHCVAPVID